MVFAAAATVLTFTAVAASAAVAADAATGWVSVTVPNPAGSSADDLAGVTCPSAANCIAVGAQDNSAGAESTLAERWNGSAWALQTTANPAGGGAGLAGVSCPSATFCEAVGTSGTTTLAAVAESWNGSTWTVQDPAQPGSSYNPLSGVSCVSASDCTAVGYYVNASGDTLTLAESWNGSTWTQQTSPGQSGATSTSFAAVACPTSADCSAVGSYDSSATRAFAAQWTS